MRMNNNTNFQIINTKKAIKQFENSSNANHSHIYGIMKEKFHIELNIKQYMYGNNRVYIKTKNSTIFTIFTIFETVSAQFAALYVYDMYDVCANSDSDCDVD